MPKRKTSSGENARTVRPSASFSTETLAISAQLGRNAKRQSCLLIPGQSRILRWVDIIIGLALLYTALYTPFEVAFLPIIINWRAWETPRFLVGRVVDACFLMDCVMQFFIATMKDSRGKVGVENLILDRRLIAYKYITGWFLFDAITVGLCAVDITPTLRALDSSSSSQLQDLAILKTLRTLRLIKLVRLVRAERTFSRWQAQITLTYGTQTVVRCVVSLLIACHWAACIIALTASMHDDPSDTWMGPGLYDFCRDGAGASSDAVSLGPACDRQASSESCETAMMISWLDKCPSLAIGTWYMAAFSWSTMVITGTGGTDFYPSSRSQLETVVVTVMVVLGALLWTQVLALFCDVATNSNPAFTEFRQTLDSLNSFIVAHGIDKRHALRLREYMHQQREAQVRTVASNVLRNLSPSLQVETIMVVHHRWIEALWFIKRLERSCVVELAMAMNEVVFAPSELAPPQHLYVVQWGVVLFGGRVLTQGRMLGEDIILSNEAFVLPYVARMMTYVGVNALSKEQLHQTVRAFPLSQKALNRAAASLALRRCFVRTARAHQERMDSRFDPGTGLAHWGLVPREPDNSESTGIAPGVVNTLQYSSTSGGEAGNVAKLESKLDQLNVKVDERFDGLATSLRLLSDSVGALEARLGSASQAAGSSCRTPSSTVPAYSQRKRLPVKDPAVVMRV